MPIDDALGKIEERTNDRKLSQYTTFEDLRYSFPSKAVGTSFRECWDFKDNYLELCKTYTVDSAELKNALQDYVPALNVGRSLILTAINLSDTVNGWVELSKSILTPQMLNKNKAPNIKIPDSVKDVITNSLDSELKELYQEGRLVRTLSDLDENMEALGNTVNNFIVDIHNSNNLVDTIMFGHSISLAATKMGTGFYHLYSSRPEKFLECIDRLIYASKGNQTVSYRFNDHNDVEIKTFHKTGAKTEFTIVYPQDKPGYQAGGRLII